MLHKHRKKATVVLLSLRPTTQCSWLKTTGTARESWCPKLGTIYKPTIKGWRQRRAFFHKGPMILVKNGKNNCSFKVFYRSVILYLAKLQYFTNLDLPEISGFPSSATDLEVVWGRKWCRILPSTVGPMYGILILHLVHIYDPNSGEYRLQPKWHMFHAISFRRPSISWNSTAESWENMCHMCPPDMVSNHMIERSGMNKYPVSYNSIKWQVHIPSGKQT